MVRHDIINNDRNAIEQLLKALQAKQGENQGVSTEILQGLVSTPPVLVHTLPTFDPNMFRELTPMLEARFLFGSAIQHGCDTWLSVEEMSPWMKNRDVKRYHRNLRKHWENSASMLFPDEQLTLFGITEDVPDSLIYLVWSNQVEPEVWAYCGMQEDRFDNLAGYLQWCLG